MTEDLSGIRFPDDGYEEEPADGKGIYQISQVFRKVRVTTPAGTDMMFYKVGRDPGFFNGV